MYVLDCRCVCVCVGFVPVLTFIYTFLYVTSIGVCIMYCEEQK